jgi:hypothetical protein
MCPFGRVRLSGTCLTPYRNANDNVNGMDDGFTEAMRQILSCLSIGCSYGCLERKWRPSEAIA